MAPGAGAALPGGARPAAGLPDRLGYEDQNDATTLRCDPLLKLVCGRLPETGADLASQPTLSRLENAVRATSCYRLAVALATVYLQERERGGVPTRVLLDLDGTADPTYGKQEGTAYHGYFRQHMYHPLLVFDGETDQLITAVLRPGNAHGARGAVAVLKRLVGALRTRWPGVAVEVRADSGFAVPEVYAWCEQAGVAYTIGLVPNPQLEARAAPCWPTAQAQQAATGAKVRLAGETRYRAGTWPHPRRVVYKAEALAAGPNTRFVVTSRPDPPLALYDFYVDRGEPELGSRTSSGPASPTASATTASWPTSSGCSCTRRLLAPGHPAPLARGRRGRAPPARHPPAAPAQDRRPGPRAAHPRPAAPGQQPPRPAALGPARRPRRPAVNTSG